MRAGASHGQEQNVAGVAGLFEGRLLLGSDVAGQVKYMAGVGPAGQGKPEMSLQASRQSRRGSAQPVAYGVSGRGSRLPPVAATALSLQKLLVGHCRESMPETQEPRAPRKSSPTVTAPEAPDGQAATDATLSIRNVSSFPMVPAVVPDSPALAVFVGALPRFIYAARLLRCHSFLISLASPPAFD